MSVSGKKFQRFHTRMPNTVNKESTKKELQKNIENMAKRVKLELYSSYEKVTGTLKKAGIAGPEFTLGQTFRELTEDEVSMLIGYELLQAIFREDLTDAEK